MKNVIAMQRGYKKCNVSVNMSRVLAIQHRLSIPLYDLKPSLKEEDTHAVNRKNNLAF